ncbi:1-deoxy-D-xylulose-5-phosphate reductoisomerase [Kineobactrum sediminis]|uniref:1-deoxy-D-xylulose 5-phosphate reductoisomerase n=1 Tax=Kineobactrum sediminis TaxID=1905677 RepID=A0A2N5Y3P2_9GAMM|nr:1-deoxy-D-xylulose-5-phosphate reductoisomerase [Kineobactrum sediminis]PLW83013.1 1-deoxy-D-xylulose-5-phosphate reductoisomerase [Kineobactrum sediminis]
MANVQNVTVLGSTGSIGLSTLDVIARHPQRLRAFALAANRSVVAMAEQCLHFRPRYAVMMDADAATELGALLGSDTDTEVLCGAEGLERVAAHADVDAVMAAIVGAAGLPSTLAAARAGKRVLLANKESLVMAGHLLMAAARDSGALLLPIDSEHNAIFQCLPVDAHGRAGLVGVSKVLLTASGGPFRQWSQADMVAVTPDQACAHPNWSMGRKISVDSASLMNKGLELIEACWLFDLRPEQIDIVVHSQSIVHSMVQYVDGSVLAQLGNPDMRTPIAYGLGWPQRLESGVAPLDLVALAQLSFEAPDEQRFPCLRLAREATAAGGTAAAVCNAANEVAVEAFLEGAIRFTDIPRVIEATLENVPVVEPLTLAVVEASDSAARSAASAFIARHLTPGYAAMES